MSLPKSIHNLSNSLSSLPGVGPKLSNRLAVFLAINGRSVSKQLSESLKEVEENITQCRECGHISESDVCSICLDSNRDSSLMIVVEDSLDLENMNSTGSYNGLFHVLNGCISPVNGIGPDDLNIESLFPRIESRGVKELIFALNPDVEGDATSIFIKNELKNRVNDQDIEITRLAKGIPTGSDIEFMSAQTLSDSLRSRVVFE
ncbi:MAG: recombination mediator RecR [Candidatus Dojkabacteria bacterium]|nr:recombination mediator RecR [Candidatus Dojkabacteria bacterium]MDQ7021704.1 recombination mediator RecR [Candidatus Dojkabacteria bacterium]